MSNTKKQFYQFTLENFREVYKWTQLIQLTTRWGGTTKNPYIEIPRVDQDAEVVSVGDWIINDNGKLVVINAQSEKIKQLTEALRWTSSELSRLNEDCGQDESITQQLNTVDTLLKSIES